MYWVLCYRSVVTAGESKCTWMQWEVWEGNVEMWNHKATKSQSCKATTLVRRMALNPLISMMPSNIYWKYAANDNPNIIYTLVEFQVFSPNNKALIYLVTTYNILLTAYMYIHTSPVNECKNFKHFFRVLDSHLNVVKLRVTVPYRLFLG